VGGEGDLREKLQTLSNLQKVDLEIAAAKKAAEGYPKEIAELEKAMEVGKAGVEAERAKVADIEQQRHTLEQNIGGEKDKVKKWEARLSEQRSTREYSALAREIDIARKANQTMVEELSDLGKALAAAREAVKAKEDEFAGVRDRIGAQMGELRQKMSESGSQVHELDEKRSKAAGRVDSTLLRRYETIRKKKLPAMAPVIAGACQGCNMSLPPQMYNSLRVSLGTDLCPSCHRIIYAAEALEDPAEK
jgi:hypothetical protein